MKIFLINPLVSRDTDTIKYALRFPPLGITYLAAALIKNGHEVKLMDRNIVCMKNKFDLSMVDKQTVRDLKDFSPTVIGFSATTPLMCDVKYFSDIVKKIMPDKKLIIGGPHPTVESEESLRRCRAIDIVVRGEGECTIVNLIDNLDKLSGVKGITFRKGENIIFNDDAQQITNLDDIPMPCRDLLDMDFYSRPMIARGLYGRFTTIFTSRGCYHRCNFCSGYNVFKGGVRFHSAKRVVSEIEDIISRHKLDYLYFAEDEFLSNRISVVEICDILIKKSINKKIKWIAQARPEKERVDKGLLKLMREAGCVQLEFGFESGSQEELERMNKRVMIEDCSYILQLTREVGIRCQANLIVGYPGQTADDFTKTVSFIRDTKPSVVQTNFFWPLPGSRVYEDLKRKDYQVSWDYMLYGDLNFSAMSDEEYQKIFKTSLWPLQAKINIKSFILFHLFHKPLFLFYYSLRYVLRRILKLAKYLIEILHKTDHDTSFDKCSDPPKVRDCLQC